MTPLRSFSVLRGKKLLTEKCDTPSITPLLIQKIHRNLKFWEEQKGSSTKVFGIFRQKLFDWRFWYSPLFIQKLSRYRSFSETQLRKILLRKSSALWDKDFSTENLDISPFLFVNLLANDNFPKHSTGLFAYDVIRYCETKNFRHKIVILLSSHPSYPKISSISEFFETQKGSPTKAFGTVRQQFFCWKLWYPLLGINFFDTRNFVKHSKVPLGKDSVLWNKTLLTESRGTRPL